MKKFIIERTIPGQGRLSPADLNAIAVKYCSVIESMDVQYHWIQSFVADHKMYCIHIAPDLETVREHSRQGGFPIDYITEVSSIIDPTDSQMNNSKSILLERKS